MCLKSSFYHMWLLFFLIQKNTEEWVKLKLVITLISPLSQHFIIHVLPHCCGFFFFVFVFLLFLIWSENEVPRMC